MKILQPIQIKGMRLKNRIAFAPFFNMPASEDGKVNDLTIRWFEERAKGGVGFVMMGGVQITELPAEFREAMKAMQTPLTWRLEGLVNDSHIPGYAKLAEVIHSYDCKIGIQFGFGGTAGGTAPSEPPYPSEKHNFDEPFAVLLGQAGMGLPIHEVSIEEIEKFKQDAAAAAARAKAAGLDCVELHSCHGITLPGCFLSPYFNRRTDEYGGDWKGRVRFTGELIRAMKDAVGEEYPVFVRINGEEFIGKWGITLEDTCKHIVPELETYGVDCISITQGHIPQAADHIFLPVYFPRGAVIHLPAAVKKATKLPVIGVGKIVDMEMAERFLQEGKADIIYMGRQLCADPETPKKYFEGRSEEIRKCIGDQVFADEGGNCGRPCSVNYDLQDHPVPLTTVEKAKKVLVIGGGVAGMEAARILATRGHNVTLMEKDAQLGGMVATLALDPVMAGFGNIVDYLTVQMRKLKVDVRVCKEATTADVEAIGPDAVILATGSSLTVPDVAAGKPSVLTHIEALRRQQEIGQNVVIWGFPGAELAISLAEKGKDVTLMGGGEASLSAEVPLLRRVWIMRKIADYSFIRVHHGLQKLGNIETLYNVKVKDITKEGIRITEDRWGERVLSYDTLIISRGRKSNDSLADELQEKVPEIHKIGDCKRVRDIRRAIWGANEVARII
jgi:2,4-dienoyl-CoA reductase-like NADH-dependent reductase (Old Yellow Enzyme family)/thioredoxin reductase